jgi:hypothetical protein
MLSPGPSRAYAESEETGASPETVPAMGVNLTFGALTMGRGSGGGNVGAFRSSARDTILSDSLTARRKPGTNKTSSTLIAAAIKIPIAKRFLYAFCDSSLFIMLLFFLSVSFDQTFLFKRKVWLLTLPL